MSGYEDAGRRRTETWADAVRTTLVRDDDGPASTPPVDAGPVAGADPAGASSANFIRGLFHVLQDASARYDDVAADVRHRAGQTTTGQDGQRHAMATLTGQRLSAVILDEQWAVSADPGEIGAAVTEAIRAAYGDVDAAGSLRGGWPFDELDRMTSDPTTLLANLGLTGHRTSSEG